MYVHLQSCCCVWGRHTARGPLRATLFFSMLVIAASGMAVLPSLMIGVTSTGSQEIGV